MRIRIAELREKRGIKQGELAERVGISRAFLSQLEHGLRHLKPDLQKKIADALGVNPLDIIDFDGPETDEINMIVDAFSSLDPQQRQVWLEMARLVRPSEEKP